MAKKKAAAKKAAAKPAARKPKLNGPLYYIDADDLFAGDIPDAVAEAIQEYYQASHDLNAVSGDTVGAVVVYASTLIGKLEEVRDKYRQDIADLRRHKVAEGLAEVSRNAVSVARMIDTLGPYAAEAGMVLFE